MKTSRTWLKELDFLRALAIILIVACHLHIYVYTGNYQNFLTYVSIIIGIIGLSLFFFVSGLSLYYNYNQIGSLKELKNYYFKRAIRIYPLYWAIFVISFVFLNLMFLNEYLTDPSFIISVLGLQGFEMDPGYNFWFVSVLLILYFIYPILIRSKNIINIFFCSTIISLIFLLLRLKLNIIYSSFFQYYFSFILGIAICWLTINYTIERQNFNNDLQLKKWGYNIIILITNLIILSLIYPTLQEVAYFYFPIDIIELLLYTLLIYFGARLLVYYLSKNFKEFFQSKTYNLIKKISFATYAIYLFHGTIFELLFAILNKFNLSVTYNNFFVITIGIPIAFISGYYIQKLEMKLRLKLRSRYINRT